MKHVIHLIITIVMLMLCACAFRISDNQMKELVQIDYGRINIHFRKKDVNMGHVFLHDEWVLNLFVNDETYYRVWKVRGGETLELIVPTGLITMKYDIISPSRPAESESFLERNFGSDIFIQYASSSRMIITENVEPGEVIDYEIVNVGRPYVSLGSKGRSTIMVMPQNEQLVELRKRITP